MKALFAGNAGPWLGVAMCGGFAFALACRLCAALPAADRHGGVTGVLLGEGRRAVSSRLYLEADTYFHKGSAHLEQRALTNDWIAGAELAVLTPVFLGTFTRQAEVPVLTTGAAR